jgi:hypothetical protein
MPGWARLAPDVTKASPEGGVNQEAAGPRSRGQAHEALRRRRSWHNHGELRPSTFEDDLRPVTRWRTATPMVTGRLSETSL